MKQFITVFDEARSMWHVIDVYWEGIVYSSTEQEHAETVCEEYTFYAEGQLVTSTGEAVE